MVMRWCFPMRGHRVPPPSVVHPAGVLSLTGVLLLVLLIPAALGWLAPLQAGLAAAMGRLPLPRFYMPLFIGVGALLPLALRWVQRTRTVVVQVLNPYLLLLLGQLLSELALVLVAGKGLGVLVGSAFTALRLLQLRLLWPLARGERGLRLLLGLLAVLWSANALQMLLRRWLPLIG